MNRCIPLLAALLLTCALLKAQPPVTFLKELAARSPIEKVYLHFDRESYIAGETAWFKAYLYSNYQPDTISSNLYIELLRPDGKLLNRLVLPVFLGTTNGQFEISDSLSTGSYLVRSYTENMIAQSLENADSRCITILGKVLKPYKADVRSMQVSFFPEGGNLVGHLPNSVAIKATDKDGLPINFTGNIVDGNGQLITSISSWHDGMGFFEITPINGERYFAIMDGTEEKFEMPALSKGISLSVIPHPQGYYFEIRQKKEEPDFTVAYMLGQMQHQMVFKNDFKTGLSEYQGIIDTRKLYSGILQITFFNNKDQPLAERLVFVDNKEYVLRGELIADTLNFNTRARNRISLRLKDTIQGSFSVSVYDAAYTSAGERTDNILTGLLLTPDIRGYIHEPSYYLSTDNDSVKTALDLVMMTNGWRRFKWTETFRQVESPPKKEAYITLKGRVTLKGAKKPFADKQLLLMITSPNKKRSTHLIQTNSEGRFLIDSLVFFDRNRLLFGDVRGKKSQLIDVFLDDDSLHRAFQLPFNVNYSVKRSLEKIRGDWQMDHEAILRENGRMLEEVTVKAKKKSSMEELDERYASGLFGGDAVRAIDLVNNEDANPYQNIFDYLQARIPGLNISQDGADYTIFYRQVATASSMGVVPMTLFLDEIQTDASFIASIPANQIALVKIFSSFAGATGNAPGGVLAVYTKKGGDYQPSGSFANHYNYNGYSVIKEFYSPQYATPKIEKPDNRITLEWRPNVIINSIDPNIPFSFYNNDRTGSFKIVVEGITRDGRILMLEKIFSGKAF